MSNDSRNTVKYSIEVGPKLAGSVKAIRSLFISVISSTAHTTLICAALILTLSPHSSIYAETLDSTNYRINGAVIDAGGTAVNSTNYSLFSTIGDYSGNPRLTSTSYQLRSGDPNPFIANVPKLVCFETTTSGSSACQTGPSYLNSNGMVRVCGDDGCYNSARFEINPQNNPSDTLYAIQISTDNFASDIRYLDGTTYKPKSAAAKEISDYLSETDWETPAINVEGLDSGTLYYLRAVALHGDFTESDPGPELSATTANPNIDFDLDITDTTQTPAETSAPYTVAFTGNYKLTQGAPAQTAEDLIWVDLETNGKGGVALIQSGQYGGLFSSGSSYTIDSANANLNSASEGFGLQNYDYSGSGTYQQHHLGSGTGALGAISVESNYNQSGNTVGEIATSSIKIYDGNGPISNGRVAIYLKAKASNSTPSNTDYTEDILFVAVGRY